MTINKSNIKKALEHQALNVKFIKRDGTERTMLCTRDFETLAEHADEFEFRPPTGEAVVVLPDNMLRVWSIADYDWRTINLDTLVSVEVDS